MPGAEVPRSAGTGVPRLTEETHPQRVRGGIIGRCVVDDEDLSLRKGSSLDGRETFLEMPSAVVDRNDHRERHRRMTGRAREESAIIVLGLQ